MTQILINTQEWTFHRETCYNKTELSNVNREKHKRKSYFVCRPDRETSRIPIESLKLLRNANKSRKVTYIHTGGAEVEYDYCIT